MENIRDIWTVHETVDEYGRKGRFIGVFTREDLAKQAAQGRGWYGGEGSIQRERVAKVDGQWYRLANDLPVKFDVDLIDREQEVRRAALAKLNPEERVALGIK